MKTTKSNSLKPIGDVIACKEIEESRISKQGLHLPDISVQDVITCEVTHLGTSMSESSLKIGDKILVRIYDSSPYINLNGDKLRMYPTKAILAIVSSPE